MLRLNQERLLQLITDAHAVSGVRKTCQDWYITYLDARIAQTWLPIGVRVLRGIETDTPAPEARSKIDLYQIFILIARSLETERESTLRDIVAGLKGANLIRDDTDDLAMQFVFQCLGWLTALFDPDPNPSTTHLSVRKTGCTSRRRSLVRQTVIRCPSVAITNARLPIQRLLRRFGSLLPVPECVRRSDAAGGLEAGNEDLVGTYLYYHNLKPLNVRLEWVDVMNQHLEFDRRNRRLRVFRLPSMCRLMYRDEEGTLLDGLCHEDEDEHDEGSHNPHSYVTEFDGFLSEVILSYRLIFGLKRRSRSLLDRELQSHKDEWRREGQYDPLLEILCTRTEDSGEVKELYRNLEAKKFEDYISVDEFPFLARRLFDLQRFCSSQNPHSWTRLWNDQRDFTVWFGTWAVVILGGGTLLFQMLQLVFQIYQPYGGRGS